MPKYRLLVMASASSKKAPPGVIGFRMMEAETELVDIPGGLLTGRARAEA